MELYSGVLQVSYEPHQCDPSHVENIFYLQCILLNVSHFFYYPTDLSVGLYQLVSIPDHTCFAHSRAKKRVLPKKFFPYAYFRFGPFSLQTDRGSSMNQRCLHNI